MNYYIIEYMSFLTNLENIFLRKNKNYLFGIKGIFHEKKVQRVGRSGGCETFKLGSFSRNFH